MSNLTVIDPKVFRNTTPRYKLVFNRFIRDLDYTVLGSPPYYVCEAWESSQGPLFSFISSSNMLPFTGADLLGLVAHQVFAFEDQVVKLSQVREVLQMAALIYPERFTAPEGSSLDYRDILGIINSSIRLISMAASKMG